MRKLVLGAALTLALGATAAFAQESGQTNDAARLVPVRVSDLDPNDPQDAAALLARLQRASYNACDMPELARPSPAARRAIENCRKDALENAVARVGAPELSRQFAALDD